MSEIGADPAWPYVTVKFFKRFPSKDTIGFKSINSNFEQNDAKKLK